MFRPASIAFAAALVFASAAVAEEPTPTLTLNEVYAAVRAQHPALAAARAEAEAARSRVTQENAWMDPKVSAEWRRDNIRPLNTYSEIEVTASQELPLSRRNKLRAEVAAAEASVADAAVHVRERKLLNDARTAFLRIAAIDTKTAVNDRLRTLLRQTTTLTRQAYESGQKMQSDLIATQTELSRLDAEQADLAAMRTENASKLNALMQRPPDSSIAHLTLPEPTPLILTPAEALAHARAHNPELTLAARRVKTDEAKLAVAQKNRAIDPEVMIRGRQMNRTGDILSSYDTGVSFSVPWFNEGRNRAQLAEARSGITAARAEVQMNDSDLAGMIAGMIQRTNTTFAQITRYNNELLPLSRQQAASQRRAYESGRAPLLDVFMAERSSIETEMALVNVRAEHALAAAEFDFLTAHDVTP